MSVKLKAIAVDDEPLALEVVSTLCKTVPFLQLKGCFHNCTTALQMLQSETIDLLFLDIRMPDISGLDFLRQLNPAPLTVFTTAHSEHAVQSFELDAIDYLLKPFSAERFLKACQKAKELFVLKSQLLQQDHIIVKQGYEQVKVLLDDIRLIESAGNYVQFILDKTKILSRLTMAEVEGLLPPSMFVRIHRSYIISRKHINPVGS
jgi:DNA-binding LytR/AlgR family response regulator